MFVLDSSGSIKVENYNLLKQFVKDLVSNLAVDTDIIRVGLMAYSDNVTKHFDIGQHRTADDIKSAVDKLPYHRGYTHTAVALKFAADTMFQSSGNRDTVPDIMFVLTDGGSTDKSATLDEIIRVKKQGIHVIVVGVGDWLDETELLAMASFPHDQNLLRVRTYAELPNFVERTKDLLCNSKNTHTQAHARTIGAASWKFCCGVPHFATFHNAVKVKL